ncbi:CinA family protein [Methylocapsa polymorpha]|uniref:CinA family protein n=1 Tax=Methylocapsa polymorpha TaxID=3080828 RepID=A0ABZ0HRM9_9HYPH|nr:CinA family protein [Methylocapsa sp. RX1]
MFDDEMRAQAAALIARYREKGLTLATAESCTGGLVAGLITEIPGSSDVFERGFVTYSNAAKVECLGVDTALLDAFGAVSREVAEAMAAGALAFSSAEAAVSVTGIAGPGGGSAEKPVGLVHFACGRKAGEIIAVERRFGDIGRHAVRSASVALALKLLFEAAG